MLKRTLQAMTVGAAILAAGGAGAEPLVLRGAGAVYADGKGEPLRNPQGVACTASGRVVAADSGNGQLLTFQFKGGKLEPGPAIKFPELGRPVRVQIDSRGNPLSLDGQGRRIVKVDERGAFGGYVQPKRVPLENGFFPVSFKLDAADGIAVLDVASQRVVLLDASGAFVRQIAWPKGAHIADVAVGAKGELLAIDSNAAQLLLAAKGASGFTPLGRSLRDSMSYPTDLTVTPQGIIVVVDGHGNGLVLLGPDGSYLGRRLAIGRNEGFVYYPAQVCVDANDDVFVADRGNQRLQAFTEVK
ncbi:MAG TPA: hypothetical protein VLW85_25650 [Myxococcales bacterium]|nr:hypothetical protein [Myxococcales bacterium]